MPETLIPALEELDDAFIAFKADKGFQTRLKELNASYIGRPTPLFFAEKLTAKLAGARVYLKREDLAHTGAHKINNAVGQALMAKQMGKKRLIAETGAGQHGVATATAAALFGMECEIYMGAVDVVRQSLNVFRMRLLGAKVTEVQLGSQTLKDAINEALRDWTANVSTTHYVMGTVFGPHPYPTIVREFQSIIGKEAKRQILRAEGRMPDCLIACVGGGSNAMGLFHAFLTDKRARNINYIGVEAGGEGIASGRHAARFAGGVAGVLQGTKSYLLQDDNGNVLGTHSVSAGLDYASVGPEHAWLHDTKAVKYTYATDKEALGAFETLAQTEGIIPALESSHAVAEALKVVPRLPKSSIVIVNISGRGDKDVEQAAKILSGGQVLS